jgi:hypothetical protein
MEPERKIEKVLRAYAKKRRAQAHEPLKLHTATRRVLQSEVARNVPKPVEEETSVSLWELFRQRWAFLLSFALIVFFGAALFLPALSSAKKKAQMVTAMNNLKQIGLAAQMVANENNGKLPATLDALTNDFVTDKILTDAESGKRFIFIAGGENLDALQSNSVLAYAPTDKKGRAVLFADGRVEVVQGAQFSELTNRQLPELALTKDSARRQFAETPSGIIVASGNGTAESSISGQLKSDGKQNESKPIDFAVAAPSAAELAANAPVAPAPTVDRLAMAHGTAGNDSTTQTKSVQFGTAASQNSPFGLQNNFKNTVVQKKIAVVLANFQVQQNGNAIRIVDQDGSVYDGSFAGAQMTPTGTMPTQVEQEKSIAGRVEPNIEPQTTQNYFFRVSGTNQTLKQNVVFAGSLLANSNAMKNLQQFNGTVGGSQWQSSITNQLPWSSSRIAGTAVVADTNNIEIKAVPLSP